MPRGQMKGVGAGVGMRGGLRKNKNTKPCKDRRGMGAGKGKNRPQMEKEAKCVSAVGKYSAEAIHNASKKIVKKRKYAK